MTEQHTPITDQVREHKDDYLGAVEDLELSHADLLAALEALLATEDDPSDSCQWCGNFLVEDAVHCRVVDCPGVEARAAIARAKS